MPYGETKVDCGGGKSHLPDFLPTVAFQHVRTATGPDQQGER